MLRYYAKFGLAHNRRRLGIDSSRSRRNPGMACNLWMTQITMSTTKANMFCTLPILGRQTLMVRYVSYYRVPL
jgi:hypothetical protein